MELTYPVLECAINIRGTHFIVEYDHQPLKPPYQKKLKGVIYERWLAILQIELTFSGKLATKITLPDALSWDFPENSWSETSFDSPDQEDLFFPYIEY